MTSGATAGPSFRSGVWSTRSFARLATVAVAGAAVSICGLSISASRASANTITVSNADDSGPGSLRQAITEAVPGDTIVLPASAEHYAVTSAELTIDKSLTISGADARTTVIDAMNSPHRVLAVTAGNVEISGVTITGGNSQFTGNGGGIKLAGTSEMTLSRVAVNENSAGGGSGGGIEAASGTSLTVETSTISRNSAAEGGGLYLAGTATITNSTIAANDADEGGGLQAESSLSLASDTLGRNRCLASASCGAAMHIGGTVEAMNTITAANDPNGCSGPGTLTRSGPDLTEFGEGCFGAPELGPLLEALRYNGGSTETIHLSSVGDPGLGGVGCPATDQRGVPRPRDLCFIGAVQSANVMPSALQVSAVTATEATVSATVPTLLGGSYRYRFGATPQTSEWTPFVVVPEASGEAPAVTRLTGLEPATTYTVLLAFDTPEPYTATSETTFTTSPSPLTPTLTHLQQSAGRWRSGGSLARAGRSTGGKPPVGTTFSFNLNEAAKVTFNFTRLFKGRRAGKTCVAVTRRNAHRQRCTRTITAGALTFSARPGSNTVRFDGLISKRTRLKPGSYALLATAEASGKRSTPSTLRFMILDN